MSRLFLCLFLTTFSMLQQAAAAQGEAAETITVTASRTPLPVDEAGSAVSVISRGDLAASQAAQLTDLLREVPGFAVSRQGPAGAVSQLRVRGAEANQVLVMIDGIEVNDIAQGGGFDFSHLLPGEVERVEIVRGPQSAIWGSDALAGVVNIITRPGTVSQAAMGSRLEGFIEAGSFGTRRAQAAWRHDAPGTGVKVFADHLDTDGTNAARQGTEKDGYTNTTAGVAGHFSFTEAFTLAYTLRGTAAESEYDGIDALETGLPHDTPFVADTDQRYTGVTLTHDGPGDGPTQRLSLTRSDTENVNHTDASIPNTSRGTKNHAGYQSDWLFQRGRLDHTLSLVAEYEEESYEQRGPVSSFGDPNKDLETDTRSLAFEYRLDSDAFSLSASYRHDNNSTYQNSDTWRLAGSYGLAGNRTRVRASVGEGVKNPTFTERFGYLDTFVGNPDLQPEQAFSWEAGIDHSLGIAPLTLGATWFRSRLEDEINGFVFNPALNAYTAENRAGNSDRRGLELTLDWRPLEVLSVDFAYTWLNATQGSGGATAEIRRPEHQASLQAGYDGPDAGMRLSVTYTGRQYDTWFPPRPPYQQRVELDAFTLVNLAGRYRLNDNVALTARVENLLDERYEEVYGYRAPGRGAYAGIRLQW